MSYEEDSARQEESLVPQFNWESEGKRARACFAGDWLLGQRRPDPSTFEDGLGETGEVEFCFKELGRWDSSLPVFLRKCMELCEERKLQLNWGTAPAGLRELIDLSRSAGVEDEMDEEAPEDQGMLTRIGLWTIGTSGGAVRSLSFIGETVLCVGRFMSGRSRMRWRDLMTSIQACGVEALPIVTLVSFLTGLTMAFVGGVQLDKFAAQIYVADLVGLAMVREMGALMVAIVMAGRTGAAFAAELGNMKVSEEIDSLRTMGISPYDFLVLPRVLALFIMIPLLVLYADVVGIIGGMVVGVVVMEFSVEHYLTQTEMAITSMWEVYSGLIKSLVFGAIIGLVGCYKGIRCGSSSTAVGRAVTSAVVTSITLVVVADALFEIVFSSLGWR